MGKTTQCVRDPGPANQRRLSHDERSVVQRLRTSFTTFSVLSSSLRWKNTKELIINHEGTSIVKDGED